jgi:probable rRNA maturation factor
LNVKYFYKSTSFRLVKEKEYNNLIDIIIKREGREGGEISIIFTSDKTILNLNNKFLRRDYKTDVIVFSNSFKNMITGDVFISIDRIRENSVKYSKGDFEKELKRVIIHGILHLIGYTDKSKEDRIIMKRKEELYLQS